MVKVLCAAVIFICVALVCPPAVTANTDTFDLAGAHGANLDKADFIVRHKFGQMYGKDWFDSNFEERKDFLRWWHENLNDQRRVEAEQAKAERQRAAYVEELRRADQRAESERAKAQAREQAEEYQAERERKRNFQARVNDRSELLDELRDAQKARTIR